MNNYEQINEYWGAEIPSSFLILRSLGALRERTGRWSRCRGGEVLQRGSQRRTLLRPGGEVLERDSVSDRREERRIASLLVRYRRRSGLCERHPSSSWRFPSLSPSRAFGVLESTSVCSSRLLMLCIYRVFFLRQASVVMAALQEPPEDGTSFVFSWNAAFVRLHKTQSEEIHRQNERDSQRRGHG